MKAFAIIPAAGLGTRMAANGSSKNPAKQFTELGGVPILLHTLRKIAGNSRITETYVALRKNEIDGFRAQLDSDAKSFANLKINLVEGGEHRQHSVANALDHIKAAPDDVVIVHDAVRPFVTPEIIDEVIAAAARYGAALAALPAVDTVKQVERTAEHAIVISTLSRERVVLAQTPQGFRYSILRKAFDEAMADGFLGTDEASLVERSGQEVVVVMGSPRNIKITTRADMDLAEFYLKSEIRRANP